MCRFFNSKQHDSLFNCRRLVVGVLRIPQSLIHYGTSLTIFCFCFFSRLISRNWVNTLGSHLGHKYEPWVIHSVSTTTVTRFRGQHLKFQLNSLDRGDVQVPIHNTVPNEIVLVSAPIQKVLLLCFCLQTSDMHDMLQ